jgi:hypothetical protein
MSHFVLFIQELVIITEAQTSYQGSCDENEVLPTSFWLY